MAIEMNDELQAKLRAAKDAGEVAAVLEAAGQQATAEEIERIASELQHVAAHDGEELSLDELDAVAGGGWIQDYKADGCVATVEYGSSCVGDDGGCIAIHFTYNYQPVNVKCTCGHWMCKSLNKRVTAEGCVGELYCPYCKRKIWEDERVYDALIPG